MRTTARGIAFAILVVLVATTPARAEERVDITATDGVQLIGDLAGTTGPGVVLTGDASGDRQHWRTTSDAIASHGFRVLRFDLRGHGESSGPADPAAADRDLEGAYRYLRARKIRPVFLIGRGLGATASLQVATRLPVAGVAIIGDPPKDPQGWRQTLESQEIPILSMANAPDRDATALAVLMRWLSDPKGANSSPASPAAR